MGGSKGSAPTPSGASTTTSSSTQGTSTGVFAQGPSAFASPLYQDFLTRANELSATPFNPQTQASVSPLNTQQDVALTSLYEQGLDMGNFDPAKVREIQSPYIQDVVNASQNWFNNQNAIQSNSLLGQGIRSGNAFGGDRMGIAQAEMSGQQQLAQAPVIAGLYQSGYTQALDEYNKLKQFGIQGAEEAVKAGTVRQAQSQRELDVAQQNAMMREAYPFQLANWYGSALGGIAPLTGTVGSAQTQSTASTEGISNPPTPNPLNQALGIGSSLIGIGGGLGLFKSGGAVGYGSPYEDDEEEEGSGGGGQEESAPAAEEEDSEISKKTGRPKTDYEREIEVISEAGAPKPVENFMDTMHVQQFKQPYSVLEKVKKAGGSGGGGSSGNSTGSTQPSAASAPQEDSGGGTLSAVGTIGGAIAGGPAGAAVGNVLGRIGDSLFKQGGEVGKYADGEEIDEGDEEDEGDTGDMGDTLDGGDTTITLPRVNVSADQPPVTQVAEAAPAATVAEPPVSIAPPSWLNPNIAAQPDTRRPAGQRTKPEGPSEQEPPVTDARDRGYTTRRIPELGPRPKTFAERWATNPFTQLGAGMLGNTSPHFGPGLASGVNAATGMIRQERQRDLLDAKPRLITSGDTVQALTGDLMVDTKIPTMTRAQGEANKRIKARQDQIDAHGGKGGRAGSEAVMDRHIQTQLRMQSKLELDALKADPDWGGRSPNDRLLEAQIRAAEKWNTQNPKYQVQVPARPAKPAEPAAEPAQPGVMDTTIKPALKEIGKGMTGEGGAGRAGIDLAKRGWDALTGGGGSATAAPAAKPAAPAQQPQQAQPQQAPRNRIIDDLKSGKVTKEQLIEDARRAAAAGKDQSIINKKLQEAGIDPISIPAPAQRPNVPISQ